VEVGHGVLLDSRDLWHGGNPVAPNNVFPVEPGIIDTPSSTATTRHGPLRNIASRSPTPSRSSWKRRCAARVACSTCSSHKTRRD